MDYISNIFAAARVVELYARPMVRVRGSRSRLARAFAPGLRSASEALGGVARAGRSRELSVSTERP